MFSTLRKKLLFWFLVFILITVSEVCLMVNYQKQRDRTTEIKTLVNNSHKNLLLDLKTLSDFFYYDTSDSTFYTSTNGSRNLQKHALLIKDINKSNLQLLSHTAHNQLKIRELTSIINQELAVYHNAVQSISQQLQLRGYKDFGIVGQMRYFAHRLEGNPLINQELLLNIRRAEKDYIIRNEDKYISKHNIYCGKLMAAIENQTEPRAQQDSLSHYLREYSNLFNNLTALDKAIGIKREQGLKHKLNGLGNSLSTHFEELERITAQETDNHYIRLNIYYSSLTVLLIAIGIILSIVISKRITEPLIELTHYITRFVKSNFTNMEDMALAKSADEIGKLTDNFIILKDEIITHLNFFKQKVDERTAQLGIANQQLKRTNEANSRFVPKELLKILGHDSITDVQLGSQSKQHMAVLFSDIRSFTNLSEKMSPQDNFNFINAFLKKVGPIVRHNNGVIDKYIGDAIMALFSKPENSLMAAVEMQLSVQDYNRRRASKGYMPIEIGIGIHIGDLILGTIGEHERMETTVISDSVNLASRMEGLTKLYGANIIVSRNLLEKINTPYNVRFLDRVRVKGKDIPIELYEVLDGLPLEVFQLKMITKPHFNMAVELYMDGNIRDAIDLFYDVLAMAPTDIAVKLFIERCKDMLIQGITPSWDGTESLTTK